MEQPINLASVPMLITLKLNNLFKYRDGTSNVLCAADRATKGNKAKKSVKIDIENFTRRFIGAWLAHHQGRFRASASLFGC